MTSDHFLDRLSLSVAQEIERELAKSHEGGASQRTACVQVVIRDALKNVMDGALASSWCNVHDELVEVLTKICSEFAQQHPLIVHGRKVLAKATT